MLKKIDFIEVLKFYRPQVWSVIEPYFHYLDKFPKFCQPGKKYQPIVDFNKEIITDYPEKQGKYVRPSLIILTARSMGCSLKKSLLTAAAMQTSEDWILNHDDLEDDSQARRGYLALHKRIGKELAVNAGDGLHILMWKMLIDNQAILGSKLTFAIQDEFFTMLNRTVLGQTAEIKWTQENNLHLTENDILFILQSKTAYYTIAGPMRLGAIMANATEKQLDQIFEFGTFLGYCFQIQDDLLDLTSDFAGNKKQIGNDIYEGKRTVMLIHLINHISPQHKPKLINILNQDRYHKIDSDVTWVISQMDKCGSLDYSRQLIKKYANSARQYFLQYMDFIKAEPYRSQILSFIDFLENRQY